MIMCYAHAHNGKNYNYIHVVILGLKEAVEKVKDYSALMKDFPLNDLLAAGDLQTIKSSITVIFNHLKKIRNTGYPVHRAICLVEAISRDLNTQMLKVLTESGYYYYYIHVSTFRS